MLLVGLTKLHLNDLVQNDKISPIFNADFSLYYF